MTTIEAKLAQHQERQYLISQYGALVVAAGFENETFTAEECLLLALPIRRHTEALVGHQLTEYDALLAALDALSEDEKQSLRESVAFKQTRRAVTRS